MRIEAEYRGANPSRSTGKKMLRAALAEQKEDEAHVYATDERQKLREHILAMSLFPNLYNKSFLLRAQGSP